MFRLYRNKENNELFKTQEDLYLIEVNKLDYEFLQEVDDSFCVACHEYVDGVVQLRDTTSHDARVYLNRTDWMVTRHRDQLELGVDTSLTQDEYNDLLTERQLARTKV